MAIANKVIATVFLEDGCKQDDDEVSMHWRPINFDIYSELFPELITTSIYEWLSDRTLQINEVHELIMAHEVERDGGGAVTAEWFKVINHDIHYL